MADPPSYEESNYGYRDDSKSADSKEPQRFSIHEEVGVSRSQRVAALASKLLAQIRERATRGLSKSTLVLLPSDKDSSFKGQLVGFPEDELPILIQLEGGDQETLEFWTQQEALDLLQSQLFAAISDNTAPSHTAQPMPERPALPPKSWFFGRKQSKVPEAKTSESKATKPPMKVDVSLDEVHFRSENEYGLYETSRARCVLVVVDVR